MAISPSTLPLSPLTADTTASAAPGASPAAASKSDTSADIGNRFLTLLVTQLKNQDPLNPLDNAQVTSQLAQLSTVNGINRLNDTLSSLVASFGASQYLQAANLVGRDVLAPGEQITLAGGRASGGFNLPESAENVVVTITDAGGQRVRAQSLGQLAAGAQRFEWDGKTDAGADANDGKYAVSVTATIGGKTVPLDALASGKVTGIVSGGNGTQVEIAGLGLVDLTSIKKIN